MKRLFRGMIFETNSSAVHSIVILPRDVFDKWKKNELYVHKDNGEELYTFDEAFLKVNDKHYYDDYDTEEIHDILNDYGYYRYTDWFQWGEIESEYNGYKTKHGDEIVVCCRYGYDG